MAVVHVDCDNFFVSCERVFRPDLHHRPIVVLSSNEGCTLARSQEAKALGIAMCQPYFQIRHFEKSHGLITFAANFELYADLSNRLMSRLGEEVPSFEQYSIDECFFEVSERAAPCVAFVLKKVAMKELSLPVTVGIGRTKCEAKLATHLAKHNKKLEGVGNLIPLHPTEREALYQTLPVLSLWGINKKTESALHRRGIRTVFSFLNTPQHLIRKWMGVPIELIFLELQGVSCLTLTEEKSYQKQLLFSRTFASPILHKDELQEAIVSFACSAGERLRQNRLLASVVTLLLTATNQHGMIYPSSTSLALSSPSLSSIDLSKAALSCLTLLYQEGHIYKKAGVLLSGLLSHEQHSFTLFDDPKRFAKQSSLMTTFDSLRSHFGKEALFLGGKGIHSKWKSNCSKRSPRYTTSWDDLPIVLAK